MKCNLGTQKHGHILLKYFLRKYLLFSGKKHAKKHQTAKKHHSQVTLNVRLSQNVKTVVIINLKSRGTCQSS